MKALFLRTLLGIALLPIALSYSPAASSPPANQPGRFVYLEGQVKSPNRYPLTDGLTLSMAIKRAGGFTNEAFPKAATFMREGEQPRVIDLKKVLTGKQRDIELRDSDKVFVPKKWSPNSHRPDVDRLSQRVLR